MPAYIDPILQEQDFAERQLQLTPEQIGQFYQAQGIPQPEVPQANEPQSNYQVGFTIPPGPAPQSAPPPVDPGLTYAQLSRGADGRLQGVGPGTSYNRNEILTRALDAGQLNPASDQYQQAMAIQQQQAQQPQQEPLEVMLSKIRLKPAEEQLLGRLDSAMMGVSNDLLAAPGRVGPQRALAEIEAMREPLVRRRTQTVQIQEALAVQQRMKQSAELKAQQLQGAKMDADTFHQRFFSQELPDGTKINGYMHSDGKPHFFPSGGSKGSADNDNFDKYYSEAAKSLTKTDKSTGATTLPSAEAIAREMRKREYARELLANPGQMPDPKRDPSSYLDRFMSGDIPQSPAPQPQQAQQGQPAPQPNADQKWNDWVEGQKASTDKLFTAPPKDMADAREEALSWAKKYGNIANPNIPDDIKKRMLLLQQYIYGDRK